MRPDKIQPRVLVVDDVLSMAETVADGLTDRGFDGIVATSSEDAARRLQRETFDALVTDLRMPKVDGLELLRIARAEDVELPVFVMTAYGAIDSAIESIRRGAYHYFTKPFKVDELVLFLTRSLAERRVRQEARLLRKAFVDPLKGSGIIGTSPAIREVFDVVERVAGADVSVLILGETGSGKGLVARTLHAKSRRSPGPFVTVNCAALPDTLLESELFGHVRGAFTGATRDRAGLMSEANQGTLFLDEIAEMSAPLQAKLLDVIERRRVRAVGDTRERDIDVRILAATHRDLSKRVASGAFRDDLRYRLDVVSIEVPPLRHRKDDIPLLVDHFLAEARTKHATSQVKLVSPQAKRSLMEYSWPGNVRELSHMMERLVLLGSNEVVRLDDLPAGVRSAEAPTAVGFAGKVLPMREVQRRYAHWAMEQMNGQKVRTAQILGIDKKTLGRWLSESGEDE